MSAGSPGAGRDFAVAGERHLSLDGLLAWRPSARLLGVAALLAAIALSPRIPIPLSIPGRAFELRVEDGVLLLLLPFWVATRRRLSGALGWVPVAFLAYLAVTFASTVFGIVVLGLSPVRAAAYWGKAVELLLIALIVATWMRTRSERLAATLWLLALGLANAAWFAVQLFQHRQPSALFQVPYPAGVPVRQSQFESYGPGLIGEISPLSTGAFLMVLFLLTFALFLRSTHRRAALGSLAAAAIFLAFTVNTVSRVSIAGAIVGAAVLAVALRNIRPALAGLAVCVVLTVGVAVASENATFNRLTNWNSIQGSLMLRVQHGYEPLLAWLISKPTPNPAQARGTPTPGSAVAASPSAGPSPTAAVSPAPNPTVTPLPAPTGPAAETVRDKDFRGRAVLVTLIGRGSGSMGTPGLLPTEAHNHFLRVFLENGLLGLAAFLGLLASAFWLFLRAVRRTEATAVDRALVATALASLAAFVVGAMLQDMFLPVIPNEMLWAMVGLAAATGLGAGGPEPAVVLSRLRNRAHGR